MEPLSGAPGDNEIFFTVCCEQLAALERRCKLRAVTMSRSPDQTCRKITNQIATNGAELWNRIT